MPQHFADFSQRGAVAKHPSGQSVAKLMCALGRGLDARAPEGTFHDCSYGTLAQKAA